MAKKKLIIVESRAKTASIGKIVGKDYKVSHCLGHIYDLPAKELGIDVENSFKPNFKVVPGKSKLVKELKDEAKDVDEVILATDPDREGESIAWHLARLFPKKSISRMTFNEITPKAITEALDNLKQIDSRLVDAQQARRVLDRLVGYKISPLLWKNLNNSRLSAGRVQSVALRLICERDREIAAFNPVEYWEIVGLFKHISGNDEQFKADFVGTLDGDAPMPDQATAEKFLGELKNLSYKVKSVSRRTDKRKANAPFITSTLQQEAASKLRFSASKTMALAQQLYEGLDIGAEGSVGLITYMRTDSVRISDDSQKEARDYIGQKFGAEYLPEKPPVYKSKSSAQDAHEAIRPTSVHHEPAAMEKYLSRDQHRLYAIIWERFVASQMEAARVSVTKIEITGDDKYLFRTTGSTVLFDGFQKVAGKGKSKNGEEENEIPHVEENEALGLVNLEHSQHFTKPPARYNEASLVKKLEELGIGRPSTYVPTIETLKKREYVTMEKRSFITTKWGFIVNDLLAKNFKDIVDVDFTANMEAELDRIEAGDVDWQSIVQNFYTPFELNLQNASKNMKFEEKTTEKCPKCSSDLVVKTGKFGLFLGCSTYPECDFTRPYGVEAKDQTEQQKPQGTGEMCDKCGEEMVVRKGRFGQFIACSGYPKCKNKKPYVGDVKCPTDNCDGKIVIRRTKKGRTFYGCSKYPDCTFASWQAPIEGESCPDCGNFLTRVKIEGESVKKCSKESCGKVIPQEDQEAQDNQDNQDGQD